MNGCLLDVPGRIMAPLYDVTTNTSITQAPVTPVSLATEGDASLDVAWRANCLSGGQPQCRCLFAAALCIVSAVFGPSSLCGGRFSTT